MDGGRLLGQGVYGCAFTPTLYCMDKDGKMEKTVKEGMVGKISKADPSTTNEWAISQLIRTFPEYKKYYLIPEEYCYVAPKKDQKEQDKEKCDPWKSEKKGDLWIQLTMPLGGRTIVNTPANVQNVRLWHLGSHLLEATTLLLVNGLVHADLHINNILMDSPTQCRIIDFGKAWSAQNITSQKVGQIMDRFQPAIFHQTPEQSVLSGLLDARLAKKNPDYESLCAKILREKKDLFGPMEKALNMPVGQMYNELHNFTQTSNSIKKEDYVGAYKYYWNKVDAWAVGVAFIILYSQLIMDPMYGKALEETTYRQAMLKVMRGLLRTDPALRMDTAQALQIWNPESAVLRNPEVKKWLSLVGK